MRFEGYDDGKIDFATRVLRAAVSDSDYCSVEIESQSRLEAVRRTRPHAACPSAAPAGESNRRYMVARVAIRTHATIWEIESTMKNADQIPLE
jgi:hypothetical protein